MLNFSARLYAILLHLFPPAHRREYGALMAQAFRDQCRAVYQTRGGAGLCVLWLYTLADTVTAALIEHRDRRKASNMAPGHKPYSHLHIFLVLVPLLAMIAYLYAAHDSRDVMIVYLVIFIAGAAAWILNRLGLLAANPIWTAYTAGTLLGVCTLALFLFSGAPAIAIYRLELPPVIILIVSLLIYTVVIHFSARLTGGLARSYRVMALLLALVAAASFFTSPTFTRPTDTTTRLVSLNYDLMQNVIILLAAAVSIHWSRRWGRTGLITLMVALGVQFIWVDPGYFTGYVGRWINLSTLLLPLVVCPAWWLLTPNRWARVRGTLVLWGILIGIAAFAPGVARLALNIDNELPSLWLSRALAMIPFFAVMWLALQSYQPSANEPEAASDPLQPEGALTTTV